MESFKYDKIDLLGRTFRLLRLLKQTGNDVECEIFDAWLEDRSTTVSYEALSYTWGGMDKPDSIKINGKRLGITYNLHHALRNLQLRNRDRILWVDAICINQGNHKERGHQVRQMADIYRNADSVIFWLGRATEETDILMKSLSIFHKESRKNACGNWQITNSHWVDLWLGIQPTLKGEFSDLVVLQHKQRQGLDILLKRPWFKRVWILQEVANAQAAVVCCGTRSVSARIFALAPHILSKTPDDHCQAILDIFPGPSRDSSWWSQSRNLYTLLHKFCQSEASESRDMIYALVGMSSDASDWKFLHADYKISLQEVIRKLLLFLFPVHDTSDSFVTSYETISDLLQNLNTATVHAIRQHRHSPPTSWMPLLIQERGNAIQVTEAIVRAVVSNENNAKEAMALLLEQRGDKVKITDEVVKAAAGNRNGKEIMALLLEQGGDEVRITEEVVKAAVENGTEMIALLLQQRGEEVVKAAAGIDEVRITEEVVKAAAGNQHGKEIMALLLQQRGNEVRIIAFDNQAN